MDRLWDLLFGSLFGTTIAASAAGQSRYWLVTEQESEPILLENGENLRIETP